MSTKRQSEPPRQAAKNGRRSRGQVLVIFAGAIFLLMMLMAVVIDVSWYWVNSLRVQRAADAAALAGAVMLPNRTSQAYQLARAEATRNGYENGVDATVDPVQDSFNKRRLNVTIHTEIGTFFMRVLGIDRIGVTRTAKAEFTLPVPMGSPQNYYGVGFLRDGVTKTTTNTQTQFFDRQTSDLPAAAATPSDGTGWLASEGGTVNQTKLVNDIATNNSEYDRTTVDNRTQRFGNFGITFPLQNSGGVVETFDSIRGVEVAFEDVRLSSNCSSTSRLRAELSWNGGANWSGFDQSGGLNNNSVDFTLGDNNTLDPWTGHTWTAADFTNANFQVRLTFDKGNSCSSSIELRVDQMRVIVHYRVKRVTTTTTTTTDLEDVPVVSPYGEILDPQKFWGGMQSQGAPNIQGDAYMTKYASRSGPTSNGVDGTDPDARYAPDDYYSYGVEMPPGTSGGEVWIFDPGFCDASQRAGTGEDWNIGSPNGYGTPQPVSAFYTLQDMGADPYSTSDDGTVYSVSSGNTFRRQSLMDDNVINELIANGEIPGGYDNDRSSAGDCGNTSWHYDVNQWRSANPSTPRRGWYLLGSGLTGGPNGTTYRLHAFSTDFGSPNDQNNTTALNAFAIYARSSGGSGAQPRVYGLGAMEAYVRLPQNQVSEFYLAQIDSVHKGKTMVINLWDPGDTRPLRATLEILKPTSSGYVPVTFDYSAFRGTTDGNAANCNSLRGTGVSAVVTNPGGSANGTFNGCWLNIEIPIPSDYSAPHPSSDSVTTEGGWWKIRYSMGPGSDYATDLTTWQVSIKGNPVHLVVP